MIFENTQEAIIDKETWEAAQELRAGKRRGGQYEAVPYRLTGLLYCADCGKKMSNDRSVDYKYNKKRNNYLCSAYRSDTSSCTIHYIRADEIEAAALDFIKKVSVYVQTNEAGFIRQLRGEKNIRQEEDIKAAKKRLFKNEKRCSELDILIKKVYEDKVFGLISEKRFELLSNEYEEEQKELEQSNDRLKIDIDKYAVDNMSIDKFIGLVKKHKDFTELKTPVLQEFIDKIIIRERDRKKPASTAERVNIYFNFVGMINLD